MAEPSHTVFAARAFGLAELFKLAVGPTRLEGPVVYTAELAAPDGPSTAGGREALQHVSLRPEGGGATLVVGSANGVDQHVELRTYGYVARLYRQRFKGAALPFGEPAYGVLLEKMRGFFGSQGFRVSLLEAPQ